MDVSVVSSEPDDVGDWASAEHEQSPLDAPRNYLSEAAGKVGGCNRVDAARIARAKGSL